MVSRTGRVLTRWRTDNLAGMDTNSLANWLVFLFVVSAVLAAGCAIGDYFGNGDAGAVVTSALFVFAVAFAFRKGKRSRLSDDPDLH